VDAPSAPFLCGLELLWAHAAEMTVAAGSIVEAIDVIGNVADRQLSIPVDLLLDPFLLEAAEEGFGDGIVPAVALPTHARFEAMAAAEAPPGVAAELGALIRMNDGAARTPPAYGHQDGVEVDLRQQLASLSDPQRVFEACCRNKRRISAYSLLVIT
jgi:hypothetical protein